MKLLRSATRGRDRMLVKHQTISVPVGGGWRDDFLVPFGGRWPEPLPLPNGDVVTFAEAIHLDRIRPGGKYTSVKEDVGMADYPPGWNVVHGMKEPVPLNEEAKALLANVATGGGRSGWFSPAR